ncbi:MAG: Flp pilus assembly protein CpaB [bacterium]
MLKEKWIIIISLALGLAAAGFFYLYSGGHALRGRRQAADSAPVASQTKPCVFVMKDVPRRTVITKDMLSTVNVPVSIAHPQTITNVKSAVGRITSDRLLKGQILLAPNLRDKDTPSELSFILPPDMRAVTIGATDTNSVANMLQPGDYVDVIVYLNSQVAGENVTFTLLRKALILATDAQLENEKEKSGVSKVTGSVENVKGYQTLTLAVSAADCVKLTLAESIGQIKFALHSPLEQKIAKSADKEIAVTGDLAKEFGFKVVKSNFGSVARASAPQPEKQVASAKANARTSERVDIQPETHREAARVVYIMRGSKIESMTAASGEPDKYAAEKGEFHEN